MAVQLEGEATLTSEDQCCRLGLRHGARGISGAWTLVDPQILWMDEIRSHHFETVVDSIVCWYLQGNHYPRVSWVQDFVHPQCGTTFNKVQPPEIAVSFDSEGFGLD